MGSTLDLSPEILRYHENGVPTTHEPVDEAAFVPNTPFDTIWDTKIRSTGISQYKIPVSSHSLEPAIS